MCFIYNKQAKQSVQTHLQKESNMLVTTLGYLVRDQKVLMLHRVKKKNDINHEKWIGIGGKLEDGETVLGCMQRECMEETGILWQDPQLRGVITFNFREHEEDPVFSELMMLYSGGLFDETIHVECNEGDLVWLDWSTLPSLNLWKGDLIFLKLLKENHPLFCMELNYLGSELTFATLNEKPLNLDDPSIYLS